MNKTPVIIDNTYELTISSLTSDGEGVGRIDGFAVFVDGALPGEIVRAQITQIKKRFARARLNNIIQHSQYRQAPPCKFFGTCGGCQLMHLSYNEQLKVKRIKVEEAFKRIGHFRNVPIQECTPSPQKFHYRNKVVMPIVCQTDSLKIGFYEKKSHQVIDINTCTIHNILGDTVFQTIRQILTSPPTGIQQIAIKTAIHTNQILVILVSPETDYAKLKETAQEIMKQCPQVKGVLLNLPPREGKSLFGRRWKTLAGSSRIEERLCNLTFEISGASFFQVNTLQAEQLYQGVIEAADINENTLILDAYCGVGTLSLIASRYAQHVYGIEMIPEAIEDAKINAQINRIQNCTFTCGLTENIIQHYADVNAVILNPPRQGCNQKVIDSLLLFLPEKIVYVSCDPTTLARDLALLSKSYSIEFVSPYDMFPQTTHVETIASLHLRH